MKTCDLCFHACKLEPGQIGFCRARINRNDIIVSLNYGLLTSIALDPIEKKPLYHFYPGSKILSVGSFGCNLRCPFCQNYDISMVDIHHAHYREVSPESLVAMAQEAKIHGNIGIAYTYNEPLIAYEYVRDCAKLAKENGLKNVLVTNGTISLSYMERLLPDIDALNIDLKGFNQVFYSKLSGNLSSVKETIELCAQRAHVEITTLIVPGENDSDEEMEAEAKWLARISPEIPLHITRFFPRYLWKNIEFTPSETLYRLEKIAKRHLRHVHIGNI